MQADGARHIFSVDPANPSLCAATDPQSGTVQLTHTAGVVSYAWRWPNGRTLSYDHKGKLSRIVAPTGEAVVLAYSARGVLSRVIDPQGRTLQLNYPDSAAAGPAVTFQGVQSIDSPVGRFAYAYGSPMPPGSLALPVTLLANLVKASPPAGSTTGARLYHYEDPHHPTLVTGVSVAAAGQGAAQRIGTYLYDLEGKGILTVRGEPARLQRGPDGKPLVPARLVSGTGIEQVVFDRSVGGQTTISNSLGQKTVYKFITMRGTQLLHEVRGPGCASCGQTNVRYGYDEHGARTYTTRLTPQGEPLQTIRIERDAHSRVSQVDRIDYKNGKPGLPQWQLRHGYRGDQIQPDWSSRPSLLEGKEVRSTFVRNEKGQLLSMSERGWAPAAGAGLQEIIERTTTYGYSVIKGRSLLTRIDGPLANGITNSPVDSDVTQLEYDLHGNYLRRIIAPGNLNTEVLEFDGAGRGVLLAFGDGVHQPIRTRRTYDGYGNLSLQSRLVNRPADAGKTRGWWHAAGALFSTAWALDNSDDLIVTAIEYDPQSRPKRITKFDGTYVQVAYDVAGRVLRMQDQDGSATETQWNTEGRQLASTALDSNVAAPMKVTTRYELDAQSRIASERSPNGAVTRYLYDAATGDMSSSIDAINRRTDYAYDGEGRLTNVNVSTNEQGTGVLAQRYQAADEYFIAGNGASTKHSYDDFGRLRSIISPDSGQQVAHYDAADRPIAIEDANGNRTIFRYDAAGNLVERVTTGKRRDGTPDVRRNVYRYEGTLLKSASNAHQGTEYIYDTDGRLVEQIEVLTPATIGVIARLPLRFVKRYSYDGLGRIKAQTLASGEQLAYSYGKSGNADKIDLQSADGKAALPIVRDIEVRWTAGLVGFTHGNGLRARYGRDKHTGQLSQLTVGQSEVDRDVPKRAGWLGLLISSAHAKSSAAPLYVQNLKYDMMGRISTIERGGSSLPTSESGRYSYDFLDRLSTANIGSTRTSWSYDEAGNRLVQNLAAHSAAPKMQTLRYHPASNRLLTLTEDGGPAQDYRYDAAGNPVRIGPRAYVYGPEGRLEQVNLPNGSQVRFGFNTQGERIAKTVKDELGKFNTTYFLYQDNKLDAESDAAGNITAQYIYLEDILIAKLDYIANNRSNRSAVREQSSFASIKGWFGARAAPVATQVSAIHTDHLGTPQSATDARQKIVWQARYSAYGHAHLTVDSITLNARFPGQYFDRETNMHYNYYRDYDPQTGRYVQSDPIGLEGGQILMPTLAATLFYILMR